MSEPRRRSNLRTLHRRLLIVGTAIYTLASAGRALAPGLATLSLCRFIAAVGGSARLVIPRAIVRDLI